MILEPLYTTLYGAQLSPPLPLCVYPAPRSRSPLVQLPVTHTTNLEVIFESSLSSLPLSQLSNPNYASDMSPPFLSYCYCFSLGLSCLALWLICWGCSLLTGRLCHYSLRIFSLNDLSKKQIWTCHSPIITSPYLPDTYLSSLPEHSKPHASLQFPLSPLPSLTLHSSHTSLIHLTLLCASHYPRHIPWGTKQISPLWSLYKRGWVLSGNNKHNKQHFIESEGGILHRPVKAGFIKR